MEQASDGLSPVLAICGSLREDSLHRALLTAVEARAPRFRFVGAGLIRDLPLMDPGLDRPDSLPSAVREFRLLAENCSAAVIASPEYVHAPSGVTKRTGLAGRFDRVVRQTGAALER